MNLFIGKGGRMKWTKETRKIKDLYENKTNPRKLTKSQAENLEKSIAKFGICEPIVINIDGTIIGGHQRCRILRKMGHEEVDVYVPLSPLTKEEIDELTIRLNKNTGIWDFDVLANNFDPEQLIEWGFDKKELHLEDEEEEKPKKYMITITLQNEDNMQEVERKVSDMLTEYNGSYKTKVK